MSARSGVSNRSGASMRSGASSNSRMRAGQTFFQRSNKTASRIYGGASGAGSHLNPGQNGQRAPASGGNRERYGGVAGGAGRFGSRSKDPYGIRTGQQARHASMGPSGYGSGHAAMKPATAGTTGSTPQRRLAGQARAGMSQNRAGSTTRTFFNAEENHRMMKGPTKTHAQLQRNTLSNFEAQTGPRAGKPLPFGQKRQSSAAHGLPT